MTAELLWALLGIVLGAALAVGLGLVRRHRAALRQSRLALPPAARSARRSTNAGLATSSFTSTATSTAGSQPPSPPQPPRRPPPLTAVDIAIAGQRGAATEAMRLARQRVEADNARQDASRQAQPPRPEAPFSALSLPLDTPVTAPGQDAGTERRRQPPTALASRAMPGPLATPAWTPSARPTPPAAPAQPAAQAPGAASAAAVVTRATTEAHSQPSFNPSELTALTPLPRPGFEATAMAGFEPTAMAAMRPPAPPQTPSSPAATPGFRPAYGPSHSVPAPTERALTVLVVDDSKVVRIKTSRLLEKHHYRVLLADDGLSAMQGMASDWPDLLISDVEMPGLDGFGLVEQLRQFPQGAALPVIMITSSNDKHREQATRAGIEVLLGKPYDEALLLAEVEKALARVARPAPAGLVLQ